MKSLFLYESTEPQAERMNENKCGIYKLNCNLVGIDTKIVNTAVRKEIVQSLKLRELYVLQQWLGNLIFWASDIGIMIHSIRFNVDVSDFDLSLVDTFVRHKEYRKVFEKVREIKDVYECDIESVSFSFAGCTFNVTFTGILTCYAENDVFEKCLNNNAVWCILAGRQSEVGSNDATC